VAFGEDYFKKYDWIKIQEFYDSGYRWKEILKEFHISSKGLSNAIKRGLFKTRGRSETLKIYFKKNNIKHSDETKKKISEIRKKYLQENPDKVPYLLNHSRKESYPEKYFTEIFIKEGIEVVKFFRIGLYELDFSIPKIKLDIEIDGSQHYTDEKIAKSDLRRKSYLESMGWEILRIEWSKYQKLNLIEKRNYINSVKLYIEGLLETKPIIEIVDDKKCGCGRTKFKKSKRCQICHNSNRVRKVERPSLEQLKDDVEKLGYTGTGKKYGVSDNAIRKWLKTI
jgi:very-short-patch-repair endonuclease